MDPWTMSFDHLAAPLSASPLQTSEQKHEKEVHLYAIF